MRACVAKFLRGSLRRVSHGLTAKRRSTEIVRRACEPLERRILLTSTLAGVPDWTFEGPTQITAGQDRLPAQNNPAIGAVTAIAFDPSPAAAGKVAYVGTAGGGVWKTFDVTASSPIWTPLTDQAASLSISALAIDPASPQTIYAGTGPVSSSGTNGPKVGVLKSTNGGLSWTTSPAFFSISGATVSPAIRAIVPSPLASGDGRLVIASDDGLYAGTLEAGFIPIVDAHLPSGSYDVTDLKTDPSFPTTIYAGVRNQGVFRSTDSGRTWANVTTAASMPTGGAALIASANRVLLSVSSAPDAGGDPVYAAFAVPSVTTQATAITVGTKASPGPPPVALVRATITVSSTAILEPGDTIRIGSEPATIASISGSTIMLTDALTQPHSAPETVVCNFKEGRLGAIWRSRNAGTSWQDVGIPKDAIGGVNNGQQTTRHLSLLADPNNDPTGHSVIYVGGDLQPLPTDPATGATNYTGRLFRGVLGDDGKMAYAVITDKGANLTAPHADSRTLAFDPRATILFEGDDGGVFKLSDPRSSSRVWSSANGNLANTEFYSVAWDKNTNQVLGAAQDVGVSIQNSGLHSTWDTPVNPAGVALQGDGTVADVFNGISSSQRLFATEGLEGFTYNGTVPSLTVSAVAALPTDSPIPSTATNPLKSLKDFEGSIPFHALAATNPFNPSMLLIGTKNIYESRDGGQNLRLSFGTVDANGRPVGATVGNVNAMVYGANDADLSSGAAPNAVIAQPNFALIGTSGATMPDGTVRTLFVRQPGDAQFAPVVAYKGSAVIGVAVDPVDRRVVYVLDSNNQVWISFHGNLPASDLGWDFKKIPKANIEHVAELGPGATFSLKTITVVHTDRNSVPALLVGGTGGIYRKLGAGKWTKLTGNALPVGSNPSTGAPVPISNALPNMTVTAMRWYASNDVLVVGTMGRGAYSIRGAAAALQSTPTLVVNGGSGDDVIELERTVANPWRLDVYEYAFGSTKPSTPTQRYHLSSINRIQLNGNGGSDQFIFNTPGGAIDVPEGIVISGGSGTNQVIVRPISGISNREGTLNSPPANGSFNFTLADPYGNVLTQKMSWSDIQAGGETMGKVASSVDPVRDGFHGISEAMQTGLLDTTSGNTMAAMDLPSATGALNGVIETDVSVGEDKTLENAAESVTVREESSMSLLRRILQEGMNGIRLESIKTGGTISTPAQLKDALDALDNVAGNVTLNSTTDRDGDGTPDLLFHAQVRKTLAGETSLAINASVPGNLGQVAISASVGFSADVVLDLTFGVDGSGFFILPDASVPELKISNLQLTGDIDGDGRIGFLGVEIQGASISMDTDTSINVDFLDPGTDAADNVIRIPELLPNDFADSPGNPGLFRMQVVTDGDAQSDLTLSGSFTVAAIVPGLNAAIPLAQSTVSMSWPTLSTSDIINLLPPGAGDAADAMLKFASLSGVDVFGKLSGFQSNLSSLFSSAVINQPLPFAPNVTVKSLFDAGKTFTDKIVAPLSGPSGNGNIFTLQGMLGRLSAPLGLDLSNPNLVNYNQTSGDLVFNMHVHRVFDPVSTTISIDTSAAGQLPHLDPINAQLNATLDFDLSFGLKLKDPNPLSTFFVQMNNISGDVQAHATGINISGSAGALSYSLTGGQFGLDGDFTLTIIDPTPDGRLTASDFQTVLGDISHFTSLTLGGSLTATAPNVTANLGNATITGSNVTLVLNTNPDPNASMLQIPQAKLDLNMLSTPIEFVVNDFNLLNNGKFNFTSAQASSSDLLSTMGLGGLVPLKITSVSLTGRSRSR
jgi:hypothetical protein